MATRIFITFLIISLASFVSAQSYLGGSIIKSIPVGHFSEKTLTEESGFANPGISLGLSFQNYFKENLGYGINFDFGNNPVDVKSWENALIKSGIEEPNIGAFDYETFNIYGSFLAKLNITKNLEIQPAVHLGVMNVSYPAISYTDKTIDSLFSSATLFSEGGDGTAISFGGELAISYKINKIKLQLATDYIYGRPRFNIYENIIDDRDFFIIDVGLLRPSFKVFYKL